MPALAHQPLAIDDDRDSPRHRLMLMADARQPDGAAFPVRLHNLSETGMLIEAQAPLVVGTRIVVVHPTAGDIVATVTWRGNELAGLQFARRLPPAMVTQAIRGSSVVWLPVPHRLTSDTGDDSTDTPNPRAPAPLPVARRLQVVLGLSLSLWAAIAAIGHALVG